MKTILTYVGAAFFGMAASACCWIPALLGAGAAGSLGVSAALTPYRPYFLGLTAIFLAFGFYYAYRKTGSACESECCEGTRSPSKRRVRIGTMWAIALVASAFAAYPYVIEARHATSRADLENLSSDQVLIAVSGIDCPACATPIEGRLRGVAGVADAKLDYDRSLVVVKLSEPTVNTEQLLKAIQEIGFEAKLVDTPRGGSL